MSEAITMYLRGAATVEELQNDDWARSFCCANFVALCEMVALGSNVQCMTHDTLHATADNGQFLDLVPLSTSGKRVVSIDTPVASYLFIFRPKCFQKTFRADADGRVAINPTCLFAIWSLIVHHLRHVVQRERRASMLPLPFSVLTAYGVSPATVQLSMTKCMRAAQMENIQQQDMIWFSDRFAVATLVMHTMMHLPEDCFEPKAFLGIIAKQTLNNVRS